MHQYAYMQVKNTAACGAQHNEQHVKLGSGDTTGYARLTKK